MYELSRVRLYSIGPAGARYADTVLDLRGVGAPVPHPAPAQAEFFEEEPVGPPRRPAPAGVLFLENGGGKSVLLKLIFSVMLPGHRNTLGGASSGVLRKFLLADDCGHVALEWQHVLTGELVVVGKASEWRGRQVSNDPRKFTEGWYSFRPGPGLSLDSLPVAEATSVRPPTEGASGARGRRRTMKGFRDALTEAGKFYLHLDVHWEEIHDRWNEHLGDLGLDPELFRYQREMNADEGEAAGLFAVKKDSDFTDLLLRAVTDTRDTDGLADLVGGFGNKLGRRAELTAERDFTAGSVDLLGRIVETTGTRARARDIHTAAERRARTLVRRIAARGAEERDRAAELAQRVTAAAHTVTGAEQARGRSALIAAELAYRHASLALAVAEKRAAAQRRELTEARTLHSAWQAAEAVLRHRAAADRAARVAVAIREAERDAAPALAARATAAGDLVRALHAAAEDGERLANEEEERSAVLQESGEAAHRDATSAATEAQRARSEIGHLRQRLGEVEQETTEAVRAGWLDNTAPDADPARAALAATDAEKSAVAAWDGAREAARTAAERAREAAAEESRAELTAARAADAALAAEHAYDAERRAAESLAQEDRLAELLSLPPAPQPQPGVPAPRTSQTPPRTSPAIHERSSRPTRVTAKLPTPTTPPNGSLREPTPEAARGQAVPPAQGGTPPTPGGARGGSPGTATSESDWSGDRLNRASGEADPAAQDASSVTAGEAQGGSPGTTSAEDASSGERPAGAPGEAGRAGQGRHPAAPGDARAALSGTETGGSGRAGDQPDRLPGEAGSTAQDRPSAEPGAARAGSPGTAASGDDGLGDRAVGHLGETGPGAHGHTSVAPGAGSGGSAGTGRGGSGWSGDGAGSAPGDAGPAAQGHSATAPGAGPRGSGDDGAASDPSGPASDRGRLIGRGGDQGGTATGSHDAGRTGGVTGDASGASGTASDGQRRQAHDDLMGAPAVTSGSADTSNATALDSAGDPRGPSADADDPSGHDGDHPVPARRKRSAPRRASDAPLTPAELDRYADELRELLDQGIASAERRLFDLRTVAADDSRILGALGDGGLLPPGPDVLATVEYLGEHGIPALPGWRYLAQAVDPGDHAAVLAARPELVDGVVITDPASHARARDVLAGAALLPRSAVAVGTAAALLAPVPGPGAPGLDDGGVFLVPPNPAMHDEHAADEERQALRARATVRDEDIKQLAARLAGDRSLAARLGSWRADCPPGMLTELAEAAETARRTAVTAEAALVEARTVRAEADEAAADTARVREERQETAQRARRVADALAGLAFRLRERAAWQAKLRELADDAAESEARAAACLERARASDEDRRAAQRAADDARRTARALRAERAEIAGAPETLPEPAPDAPRIALPALREAYRAASQLYEKVGVGADLRAEQSRAESDESAAVTELDRLSNKVRTRAAQLLESTDGADGPSRQAAAARAESLVQMLETRATTASEQLGRLRGEAERLAPADGEGESGAHTDLPEDLVPADVEQAQSMLRTATTERALRTDALDTARAAHGELLHFHRAAEDAAGGFDETSALLRDLLRGAVADDTATDETAQPPEPYPGSLEEARQAAAEARRSLRACAQDLSTADAALRETCDVLVRHANSTRYEQVRTPARQQIRELPASALPEHAERWAAAFAPRLRVLTDELAQLERNRESIVDRLRGLVESALTTLRSAQRLSRLPEGLGEWSGQEFLRIRFEEPDRTTLTERLGDVVDEATRAALKKNSDLRRDGISLLLRGVQAALQPKGIAVEILKPDAVLRAERVPVGQMGDVFSGGQLLTAAIALYCTMAALRSNDRGRDKHRHAGTLFLDNPIGRANATYLLELQRAVSDALGVQLLYTTGLFDTTALAEFPLVIRLRNDADLRAGLKYISVEEHLRPGLPKQDPDGEVVHGEITATRMFKRSQDAVATEGAEAAQE
ncbi:hypothetical protein ACIO1C_21405 [Streptomyces sp. NPDC087420]|uniref:hypothetical protein n=1 Tax=Streptomyces sp. NPDC087420 TaxID=3365785 RepID=UPI003838386D